MYLNMDLVVPLQDSEGPSSNWPCLQFSTHCPWYNNMLLVHFVQPVGEVQEAQFSPQAEVEKYNYIQNGC